MILGFILLMAVLQITLYMLCDRLRLKYSKLIITAIIIFCNVFVFPEFFMPDYNTNEARCGMPAIAVTFGFWIIGNGIAILTALVYKSMSRRISFRSKYRS